MMLKIKLVAEKKRHLKRKVGRKKTKMSAIKADCGWGRW